MQSKIDDLRKTRTFLLQLLTELSVEQLNTIPHGFRNNIVWNLAHLVATQQGFCYTRAGLPQLVDESFYNAYKPGSAPEKSTSQVEVDEIKRLLLDTLDSLTEDYKRNAFKSYTPWTTRSQLSIASVEDAVDFMFFHEGMHTGYIMALKRVILTSQN